MIRNLIFDMGGVLVDLDRSRAIASFEAIGVADAAKLIDHYQHNGLFLDIEDGRIDGETFCRRLSEHTGKQLTVDAVAEAWKSIIAAVPPYKFHYLTTLRPTYNLYLLSNNNPFIIDWACSDKFLPDGTSIADYFDKMYLSYQLKCTKPGHKIYELMLRDSGMKPEESLFIEDGLGNVETAKSLGIHTLHVLNGEDWRSKVDEILSQP